MDEDDECPHGMASPHWCSICKHGVTPPSVSQDVILPGSIETAVRDLPDEFTTMQVATHPLVVAAHGQRAEAERFPQAVGSHLTAALGQLGIRQISTKGVSNARWRKRSADADSQPMGRPIRGGRRKEEQ